jgi:hypothetical protein
MGARRWALFGWGEPPPDPPPAGYTLVSSYSLSFLMAPEVGFEPTIFQVGY